MNQQEALRWLKLNYQSLAKSGKLTEALDRYFRKFPPEKPAVKKVEQNPIDLFDGKLL